jgi:hypothetical protein
MCHVLFIKGVAVLSMRSALPQQAHVLDNAMGFTAGEQELELGFTVLAACRAHRMYVHVSWQVLCFKRTLCALQVWVMVRWRPAQQALLAPQH